MSEPTIPIIRIELEGMRQTLMTAMHEYTLRFDKDMQEAIAKFVTAENICRIIDAEANRALDHLVKAETWKFFTEGDGRKVISEAVLKKLADDVKGDADVQNNP